MIDFLKYRMLFLAISAAVILTGIVSIATGGFTYSIDFVGGTNVEYQTVKPLTEDAFRVSAKKVGVEVEAVSVKGPVVTARMKPIDEKQEAKLRNDIQTKYGKVTVLRTETVGPTLGQETINKTLIASLLAMIGILLYMGYSFKGFNFAVAAILAMMHDLLVILGTYSLLCRFLGAQVDTLFVTAVLTAMSFSVHDTIIIFDKIREYKKTSRLSDIRSGANMALTQTLVRSVNNSMTIIFMLLALTLLGGTTIKFFVATLLIGTITGTYSSPFVATPILVWLESRKKSS